MLKVKYKLIPAGFWRRLGALVLDALIVSPVVFLILILVDIAQVEGKQLTIVNGFTSLTFWYLYPAILDASPLRGTFGKRILGLRVVTTTGRQISFGQALGRNFGKILSFVTLLVGFFMAGWTEKKQALHDKMAATLVMKRVPVYVEQTSSETPLALNTLAEGARRGTGALTAHDFSQYVGDEDAEEIPDSDDDEEY